MQERTVHQKHAGANRRKKAEQAKEIDIKKRKHPELDETNEEDFF